MNRWGMIAGLLLVGCTDGSKPADSASPTPCAVQLPERQALYGDLHVHTSYSFDAGAYGSTLTTADAYRFAKGERVWLPPLDEQGSGTRPFQLERPLDFVGVTEHGEFLGEVLACTTKGMKGYESETCAAYRGDSDNGAFDFGVLMAARDPKRFDDICGEDGTECTEGARLRWALIRRAAEEAQDASTDCSFTALVGYEYTNTTDVSNLHRNVIFRSSTVPALPVTHFDAPTPIELWRGLDEACTDAGPDCDVLVLPHNGNLSNGQLFTPDYGGATSIEQQVEVAALRARMEPVVEIFQHKGDSECRNGFEGIPNDPQCAFEKLREPQTELCEDDQTGSGGMRLWGCSHKLDFARNVLLEGLSEEKRIGLNPYRLGFIGSTDTHNGIPGAVSSVHFPGHVGIVDATASERLGFGNVTHDGIINNPGGLAAVWAEENSRHSIFDAIRRRETFATSGPRIPVRMFAGESLEGDLCDQEDRISMADAAGVPMGGSLPSPAAGAPRIFVEATADPGTASDPGTPLQQIQIIKGWLNDRGQPQQQVITVAGSAALGSVDPATCQTDGAGRQRLCTVWEDPDWDPAQPTFYYARVLEAPTCRWSTRQCAAFPTDQQPAGCDETHIQQTVQQRAWSSPIWVETEP